jgi:hypothetical protein
MRNDTVPSDDHGCGSYENLNNAKYSTPLRMIVRIVAGVQADLLFITTFCLLPQKVTLSRFNALSFAKSASFVRAIRVQSKVMLYVPEI